MEAASVSGEFVPVDPEFVRQIGKSIQKLLVAARAGDVSADRVILLGKRQRADERRAGRARMAGRRERGKFARNYIYGVRSGTLTHGERSYTDGGRSEVFRETAAAQQRAVFLFWCTSKKPKRFSKRSRSLFYAPTTDRDGAQRDPFIFAGLLDAADVRTKGPSPS